MDGTVRTGTWLDDKTGVVLYCSYFGLWWSNTFKAVQTSRARVTFHIRDSHIFYCTVLFVLTSGVQIDASSTRPTNCNKEEEDEECLYSTWRNT